MHSWCSASSLLSSTAVSAVLVSEDVSPSANFRTEARRPRHTQPRRLCYFLSIRVLRVLELLPGSHRALLTGVFAMVASLGLAADPSPAKKTDLYLVLPEPAVMRSANSKPLGGARKTVFTPVKQSAAGERTSKYSAQEFAKLGISWDSFVERAKATCDKRLAALQPDLIKDKEGTVIYAVYRGDDPSIACLLVAPSFSQIFEKLFGDTLWLVSPDRHSLYIFPAKSPALAEFATDLKDRFESSAYGASEEIFELKKDSDLRVVGNFTGRY